MPIKNVNSVNLYSCSRGWSNMNAVWTPYQDFPIISMCQSSSESLQSFSEVSFSGERNDYCVCYVDMVDSTNITSQLSEDQIQLYYSTFLNSVATIAKNFGAKIIKNAGDCLIFYFPLTIDAHNIAAFSDVLECGITIMAAHKPINAKLLLWGLPFMNYRISADHGNLHLAKSTSSSTEDFFGSTMNRCAKINSKAPINGMVVGSNLYGLVHSMHGYTFEPLGEYSDKGSSHYQLYSVKVSSQKQRILNPFTRTSVLGTV